jgi:hypothetical protein
MIKRSKIKNSKIKWNKKKLIKTEINSKLTRKTKNSCTKMPKKLKHRN